MKLWLKIFVILSGIVFLVSFGCNRAGAVIWGGTFTLINASSTETWTGSCGGWTILC